MKTSFLTTAAAMMVWACPVTAADHDSVAVEFVTARQQEIMENIELTGSIEARDSVDLAFRQSGRVTEVLVEEGDRVTRNQPLARLDPVQQEQGQNVAQASLAAARAVQAQAQQASDRAAAMLERGVGTIAMRDTALQRLSMADGAVERAESALEQAQRALADTVLYASDDAVVTARHIAPGQIIGAAQPAFSVAELDGLEAVFQSADLPQLDNVMGASVRLDTINVDRPTMSGTITEISPLVDPQTGTVAVRARMDVDTDLDLLGAAVRGRMQIGTGSGVAVPWTALTRHEQGAAVWLVRDGKAELTPVRIADFSDNAVFLSQGVQEGQTVVGAGSQLLYPGRTVRPAQVPQ